MKESKKVSAGWRTAAIIFGIIILIMVGLTIYGVIIQNAEENCVSYCYEKNYESFSYDASSGLCSCFTGTKLSEIIPI
jgi:hypothetical protein